MTCGICDHSFEVHDEVDGICLTCREDSDTGWAYAHIFQIEVD